MQLIKHARVPIIKFRELHSGLHVDISFDVTNGPANTAIVKEFAAVYPLLRPLLLVRR
jgi:non-canonical poly(A) RNA polymerase PAPD5/7